MDTDKMKEIKDVLLQVRHETDYNIGSPQALDHLLCHVVSLIDAILDESKVAKSEE